MKCAIYIRTGSKNNQAFQIKTQAEGLKHFIAEQNWELYDSYIDTSSGSNKYKKLQALIEDAKNCKFDVILATDVSRLFRHLDSAIRLKELCATKKIHIITLDNSINTLHHDVDKIGLYAWMIDHESKIKSQIIKNGIRKAYLEKQNPILKTQ